MIQDVNPAAINRDIVYLWTLRSLIRHVDQLLEDIDLQIDPSLIQPGDLDLMPEMLGDLKSSLGAVTQITARMFLTERPED